MQSTVLLLLGLSALALGSPTSKTTTELNARQDPNDIMMFDCSQIPEVCTNMCYGAYCQPNGQSLTYDVPPPATSTARRTAAGCYPRPNRCSTSNGYQAGYNCDEYPFASTGITGGGTATRVNRCVPTGQNSMQGGTISAFYSGAYCNNGPCSFTVGFENSGTIMYCDSYTGGGGSCTADANEVIGPNNAPAKVKRDAPSEPMPTYMLASGSKVVIPAGANVGQRAWRVKATNQTLWMEQTEGHIKDENIGLEQYQYMLPNLSLEQDTIAGLATE